MLVEDGRGADGGAGYGLVFLEVLCDTGSRGRFELARPQAPIKATCWAHAHCAQARARLA